LLIAAAVSVVGFVSVAHSTSPYGLVPTYVRWLWPISMFVWLVLGLAIVRALRPWFQRVTAERPLARHATTGTAAFSIGLVAVITAVGIATIPTVDNLVASPAWSVPVSKKVVSQALPRLRGRGPVLVDFAPNNAAFAVGPAVLAALTTHGIPYVVDQTPQLRQVGENREWKGHNARLRVVILGGSTGPDHLRGLERIAFVPSLSPAEQREMHDLQARIIERIRTAGGVTLTPTGRGAIAKHQLSTFLVGAIRHSKKYPQLVTDSIHDLVQYHLIALRPLGTADVLRYRDLSDLWVNQTVSVVAGPVT
jgi:hypothetical protein